MKLTIHRKDTVIRPDNNRVIARFFFNGEERAEIMIMRILAIPENEAEMILNQILREFSKRHRSITGIFRKHFNQVKNIVERVNEHRNISEIRKLLIGSYFTMEYALESAALFNPSIVEDRDQSGLQKGQVRVILSLRATGEGHISSLVFRRAVINQGNEIMIQESGDQIGVAELIKNHLYEKRLFSSKLGEMEIPSDLVNLVMGRLPDKFTYDQIRDAVVQAKGSNGHFTMEKQKALDEIIWLADSRIEIRFSMDTDLTERVIFPISRYEKNGIEDARFVRFREDNGSEKYYGIYTAFDGYNILPKLIETIDFRNFNIIPLHGKYAIDKNLALFPRKVNGKYAMISRIDGVNNYIMFSDNLHRWSNAEVLQAPLYPWELVQIGNGGSPIETEKGWLMITHGVGPVRKYSLGACLLDLENPTRLIGRLKEPLLIPVEDERAGYVPNVVYTCGSYVHNGELIIPYAMSDYATAFASMDLNELLETLTSSE
ncbi:MAG: glycoside hydrolase family 130 protein [Bacteroidales bacterium]|nr:glycoside hydrolase family 130 protein [Bacteroidales bacterium]HDS07529.1 glycosidase [Bacteroides sp.]